MSAIVIVRAGPMSTIQDDGRFGMLAHGISASGPMDRGAFARAGGALPVAGSAGIEFSQGLTIEAAGEVAVSGHGGNFVVMLDGREVNWPLQVTLRQGQKLDVAPGANGNYGYLRFGQELTVPAVLGSRSTNVTVGLGGFKGRALKAGDRLEFDAPGITRPLGPSAAPADGPIRVLWGLHADLFDSATRRNFAETDFLISNSLDRMGVRLVDPLGVFAAPKSLTLVSDAIVPGDIQILGDGTPIVLMRDHQPTGGYPRIATIVSADLDRFAQLRPGTEIRFRPVTLEHAR